MNSKALAAAALVAAGLAADGRAVVVPPDVPRFEVFDSRLADQSPPMGREGVRLEVPFFPEGGEHGGSAALASVLGYWRKPADQQSLARQVHFSRVRGALPLDLVLAAHEHGVEAAASAGSLETMRAELRAGRPLIAFLNLGSAGAPRGHFLVVTGFDENRGGLYVHTGMEKGKFLRYGDFLPAWNKTQRWTLLVLPKQETRNAKN